MKRKSFINIEIDRLTNSIENALTGDKFDTEVVCLSKDDNKLLKKLDLLFDWHYELKLKDLPVFKLVIKNNEDVIPGWFRLA